MRGARREVRGARCEEAARRGSKFESQQRKEMWEGGARSEARGCEVRGVGRGVRGAGCEVRGTGPQGVGVSSNHSMMSWEGGWGEVQGAGRGPRGVGVSPDHNKEEK